MNSKAPSQRNSVNSSFSTIRLSQCRNLADNASHDKNIRFSYQENQKNIRTFNKENIHRNSPQFIAREYCFNHKALVAQYSVLSENRDKLYCCDRCAFLVASKGFEIERIRKIKQDNFTLSASKQEPIKDEISEYLHVVSNKKEFLIQKYHEETLKIDEYMAGIDEYFLVLQQYLEAERSSHIKHMIDKKRALSEARQRTINSYFQITQELKNLTQEVKLKGVPKTKTKMIQISAKLQFQDLNLTLPSLRNVQKVGEEIRSILYFKEPENPCCLKVDKKSARSAKREAEESSMRSLRLSFEEEESNFTLNNFKNDTQSREGILCNQQQ